MSGSPLEHNQGSNRTSLSNHVVKRQELSKSSIAYRIIVFLLPLQFLMLFLQIENSSPIPNLFS